MKPIINQTRLIAACGLYCGACRKHLKGKCPGCENNGKATWCKIRLCCREKGFHTCADCPADVKLCTIHNNVAGKIFSILFNSDRAACIRYISKHGEEAFSLKMATEQRTTMGRRENRHEQDDND